MSSPYSNFLKRLPHILRLLLVLISDSILRFCDDFVYLFKPNKIFIYSWMKYKGAKMLHNNWGDDINKFFIEEISNTEVKDLSLSFFYKLFPVKAYSCIGSILGDFPLKRTEVWGSGFIEEGRMLKEKPLKIHSVRGPLTRRELLSQGIDCPERYGDPALLISRYYRKNVEKKFQYGIVPHYIDENNQILIDFCQKHPEFTVIRMKGYKDWHDIPDQIMQCQRIISSSLHGLIMADSYEIPNVWVRFSDDIKGGDFKYKDYFLSVGRMIESPLYIKSIDDLERIIINDNTSVAQNIDYRSIYEACPFRDRLYDYE